MTRLRVSTEDLNIAILWLESYEATDDGDEGQKQCQRVADWLKKELEERMIKKIMRDHKVTRAFAEDVLTKTAGG